MTVTVTNTNNTLWGLMSKAQRSLSINNRGVAPVFSVQMVNTGSVDVYIEIGDTSTTSTGMPIAASGGALSIRTKDLAAINLIASTDCDLRFIINDHEAD